MLRPYEVEQNDEKRIARTRSLARVLAASTSSSLWRGRTLGSGNCGQVLELFSSNDVLACKTIVLDGRRLHYPLYELYGHLLANTLVERAHCPHFILYHRFEIDPPNVRIFQERAQGSLEGYLEQLERVGQSLTNELFVSWFVQICMSILTLQESFSGIHNDVYLRNVLYNFVEPVYVYHYRCSHVSIQLCLEGMLCKLADFGLFQSERIASQRDPVNRYRTVSPPPTTTTPIHQLSHITTYKDISPYFRDLLSLLMSCLVHVSLFSEDVANFLRTTYYECLRIACDPTSSCPEHIQHVFHRLAPLAPRTLKVSRPSAEHPATGLSLTKIEFQIDECTTEYATRIREYKLSKTINCQKNKSA